MPAATFSKEISHDAPHSPVPRNPPLMKCALVDAAFDKKGWIFEPKFDGLRVICIFDGDDLKLLSRNDKPQNSQFPEIVAGLKRAIRKPAVVDGEIVCLDENGKSSFRLLQQRFHLTVESLVKARMAKFPAHLYLFDILYFDKFDLRQLSLTDRKRVLKQAVRWKDPIRMTPMTLDRGIDLFEEACKRGEEGIIAKRSDSRYTGDRGGAWLKIKCAGRQEFVIGGFTEGKGSRMGFGALLIGYFEDGKFTFAGKVGTGFDSRMLVDLHSRLKQIEIEKNPFANGAGREAGAHFVEPKLVAEIAYAEWTQNHMLRQPRFQGLREDKNAKLVNREDPAHVVVASQTEGLARHENTTAKVSVKTKPVASSTGNRRSRPRESNTSRSAKPQAAKVQFTHLDKVMFPDAGVTKGDLLEYYAHIAPQLLPHLRDRPITIERLPDGLNGPCFWQKNTPRYYPGWIPRVQIPTVAGKKVEYALVNDLQTLLYFVNQGTITFHTYLSRVSDLDKPDYVLFDLDPGESKFSNAVTIAKKIEKILGEQEVPSFPKTSGKSGLHILAPWKKRGGYDEARDWAMAVASEAAGALPKIATIERSLSARGGRVYVDVMQNAMGKHVVPPYVVRVVPEGTVSTPLKWSEVTSRLSPKKFDTKTVLKRVAKLGDVMKLIGS